MSGSRDHISSRIQPGIKSSDMTLRSAILIAGASGQVGRALVNCLLEENDHLVIGIDIASTSISNPRFKFYKGSVLDMAFLAQVAQDIAISGLELAGIVNAFVFPEFNNDLPTNSSRLKSKFPNVEPRTIDLLSAWSDFPEEPALKSFQLNCLGANNVVSSQLENLLASRGCSVVHIASQYGIKPPRQDLFESTQKFVYKPFAYSTSKAALLMLSKYQASLFSGTNVRVNSISPGIVRNKHSTEFISRLEKKTWTKGILEIQEVVSPIMFMLSDGSKYMNGANLVIDGGWTQT